MFFLRNFQEAKPIYACLSETYSSNIAKKALVKANNCYSGMTIIMYVKIKFNLC